MSAKSDFSRTLADTISVGMNECYSYGMTYGCDSHCPVLRISKCELQNTENKHLYEQINFENE